MNTVVPSSEIFEQLKKEADASGVLLTLVSIKDLARDRFHPPRGVTTTREAVRDFKELVDKDPQIMKNAHDFELYCMGLFNPIDGAYIACPPSRISRAVDFVKV